MATTYGLTKIEIADILPDGGCGTTWTQIGYTKVGATKMATEAGTETKLEAEELSTPLITIAGEETISLQTQLIVQTAENLLAVLGGTVTGSAWAPAASKPVIEKSMKITPKAGKVVTIPRVSIVGSLNSPFTKTDLMYVDVKGTILAPSKSGENWMIIE